MAHAELVVAGGGHITFAHFPRKLTREHLDIVCRGLDKLGKRGGEIELYWGAPDFVGYRKNTPAILIEDANGVFTDLHDEFISGLAHFGIPTSTNFGPYNPHVTTAPPPHIPWTLVPLEQKFVLVSRPNRIDVTFS